MRKIVLFSIATLFLLPSCVSQDPKNTDSEDTVKVEYDVVKPTSFVSVPTKAGYITKAYYNGELVCETAVPMVTEIPTPQNMQLSRAANPLSFSYEPIPGDIIFESSSAACYKVIMFEDVVYSKDMDYNDLIIHVKQSLVDNTVALSVQPIAMGNAINLRLGADLYIIDAEKKILKKGKFYFSNNVKQDLFGISDKTRILNTSKNIDLKGYPMSRVYPNADSEYSAIGYRANGTGFMPQDMSGKNIAVNWFIEDDGGNKFYAIPSNYTGSETWLAANGYPYGFVITELRGSIFRDSKNNECGRDWINYPAERVNINTVYPGFEEWIQGGSTIPDWANPIDGTFIDAMRIGADGIHSENSLYDTNLW